MIISTRGQIIELKGSMRRDHTPALLDTVKMLLRRGEVAIDCSGLAAWNAAGLQTMRRVMLFNQQGGGRISWCGMSDELQRALGESGALPLVDDAVGREQPAEMC